MKNFSLAEFLDKFISINFLFDATENELFRARLLTGISVLYLSSMFSGFMLLLGFSLAGIIDVWIAVWQVLIATLLYLGEIIFFKKTGRLFASSLMVIGIMFLGTISFIVFTGGWISPVVYFLFVCPLCAFLMMGYKWGSISAIFGIATYITFAVLEYYETPMLHLVSDNLLDVMRLFCWIYTWIICVGGVTLYNMTISNLNQEINADREELRRKATFDEDTGIYTRNAFVQILKERSENMKPGDKRLALIYMDFVSTTASNMVAKAALRDILQDMQNNLKDTATFSRYGGLSLTALIESDQDRDGTVNMIREIYDDLSSQLDPEQVELNAGAVLIPDFSTDLDTITQGVRKALHLSKDEHSGVVIYSRGIGETDEDESRARILRLTFEEIMTRTAQPGNA